MRKKEVGEDDYEIIDNGPENFQHVKLGDSSPFPGLVYQYGEVQLLEEGEHLRVKYVFEIFDNPNCLNVSKSKAFSEYAGEILMVNLREFLIYMNYQKGRNAV